MRRDIGQIIVASAILEDTIGWIIVAMHFSLASAARSTSGRWGERFWERCCFWP